MRYILTPDNTLRMDYRVSTDEDTIINLTNHTYFNLDGGGNVLGQKLRIYASNYLEGNNETCPTARSCPWTVRRWTSAPESLWDATSTPASTRPPWRAAALTTAMSSTGPGREPEPLRMGVQR